jgi:hypothetical protein
LYSRIVWCFYSACSLPISVDMTCALALYKGIAVQGMLRTGSIVSGSDTTTVSLRHSSTPTGRPKPASRDIARLVADHRQRAQVLLVNDEARGCLSLNACTEIGPGVRFDICRWAGVGSDLCRWAVRSVAPVALQRGHVGFDLDAKARFVLINLRSDHQPLPPGRFVVCIVFVEFPLVDRENQRTASDASGRKTQTIELICSTSPAAKGHWAPETRRSDLWFG